MNAVFMYDWITISKMQIDRKKLVWRPLATQARLMFREQRLKPRPAATAQSAALPESSIIRRCPSGASSHCPHAQGCDNATRTCSGGRESPAFLLADRTS